MNNIDLDHPRPRAHRTLTLITKALQTLANLTTFGSKEPWMEPMNQFLNSHRQEFKAFVDSICGISPERATSAIPPSYATPITILGRLPCTSREGFPSLPYLIDQAKECAALITLWLEARNEVEPDTPMSEELKRFDALCEQSWEKTKSCLHSAEKSQRQSGVTARRWEGLVEQMERKAKPRAENGRNSPDTPRSTDMSTDYSSASSIGEEYVDPSVGPHSSYSDKFSRAATSGEDDRVVAEDNEQCSGDETDTAPMSSSAVWDPGVQDLDEDPTPPSAVKDEDEDSVGDVVPASGSSIYRLDRNPTNQLTKHKGPSGRRSKHGTNAKSIYVLNTPGSSERDTGSEKLASNRTPTIVHKDRTQTSSIGKSIYRLKEGSTDSGGGRRSPASRDGSMGILRVGDFGNLFKRRGKEKDDG